ncbi:unnamed protein product [Caenorhabditis angaria]|uniref:Uncharacterized protein n=1 Tax=Caenorhabditis angaria TaxID=860376 RepID=A0A9P1IJK6_9PELO|nr:unnamed protein product [Caenorhabditis angaria]
MLKFLVFCSFFGTIYGKTKCVMVIGKLKCPELPELARNVQIDLYDEDALPLESDDLMGRTWSDSLGNFKVTGCGSDFGPINTPDPYLYIQHSCPHRFSNQTHPIQVDVLPIFLPKIVNLGNIYLDRYLED